MTSPGVGKPDNTFRNNNGGSYQQTHSKGSGFGQDLSEGRVRELLTNKVAHPFAKAASGFNLAMGQMVTGVAQAISGGGGASYSEVRVAMDTRITPINNAITKAGERITELGNQVSEIDRNQLVLTEEQLQALDDVESAAGRVQQMIDERAEFDRRVREDVDRALEAAESASTAAEQASGRLDELNKGMSDQITQAVSANEDIKTAVSQANKAVEALGTRYEIGASLIPVDPFTRQPEWASAVKTDGGVVVVPGGTNHRFENPTPVRVLENTTYRVKKESRGGLAEFRLSTPENAGTDTWVEFERADNPRFDGAVKRAHLALDSSEFYIRFPAGVSEIVINRVYNTWSSDARVAKFEIAPLIPDQAAIDRLQDEAIMKNEKVGASNATAIDILLSAQQTQELVNQKQGEWNAASEKATRANTAAVRLLNRPDEGDNLLRYLPVGEEELGDSSADVELDRPAWASDTSIFKRSTASPSGYGHSWYYSGGKHWARPTKVAGQVKPGQRSYRLRFSAGTSGDRTSALAARVRSSATNKPIESSRIITGLDSEGRRTYTEMPGSGGEWLLRNAKFNSWTAFDIEVVLNPEVTDFWVESLFLNDNLSSTDAPLGIWITEMSMVPDVPSQADVDTAQTKAIESLTEASRLGREFEVEQMRLNRLTQNQIWAQQDLIELLDIRTPKVHGEKAYRGHEFKVNPPFPGFARNDYSQINHQFFTSWENNTNFIVAARGRWTGHMTVSLNWTSGVIDRWVVKVTDKTRAWNFRSTPLHIDHRAWEIVMYPESLNREATVTLKKGNQSNASGLTGDSTRPDYYFYNKRDAEGLVRDFSIRNVRLKNTVVCDKDVYYRDEDNKRRKITRGRPIVGVELFPEDQEWFTSSASEVTVKFTEVNDKTAAGINYSVPNILPSSTENVDASWDTW